MRVSGFCDKLKNDYKEFSNIIICIYSDDRDGKDLAMGKNESVSLIGRKNSWLSMFTYNSVEGAYFDTDPSGYLVIN